MDYFSLTLPKQDLSQYEHTKRYFIKKHVLEALQMALEKPTHAAPILRKYFRRTRALGSKDRRRVSDIVYTIIRCSDIFIFLGYTDLDQWFSFYQNLVQGDTIPYDENRDSIDFFSICTGIPKNLCQSMYNRFPDSRSDFILWTHQQPPTYIRTCLDKINTKNLQQKLFEYNITTKIVPQVPTALQVQGNANLLAHPLYKKGYFEIQDLSSQRFCFHFDVKKKRIFDVCAGAGGKSLAFASQGATVFAHDIRSHALQELQKRAQRGNYQIQQKIPNKPDIIVIDAPCSGTGRIAREPTLRWKFKHWDPLSFVSVQKELIQEYQKRLVSKEQILVYATCSLLDEENEHDISDLQRIETNINWPHKNLGDGFYWATYQRK